MRIRTAGLVAAALLALPVSARAQQEMTNDTSEVRNAWGARRSFGLAVGEVALVNAIPWFFNEFIRGGNFTQVNPRSWVENISNGFFFDDNQFNTNFFAHPYHGSLYYSAARSNGLSYWQSAPFSLAGSFFWECCGETHPMAWNDWMATGIGGIAIGETLYRVSSTVLDNQATGPGRIGREVGAFFIDPVRGFNRVVSGRAGRVYANPVDPQDHIPDHLSNYLRAGYRRIESSVNTNDSKYEEGYGAPFVEFDMRFGDPFEDSRHKPFDQFQMDLKMNFGDATFIGGFRIVGNLVTKDLSKSEGAHHLFVVTQNFDYNNTNVVEFGGQAFGAGILSKWRLSDSWSLRSDLNLHGYVLNSVNSEYAFSAEVPDREALRKYDMGAGAGTWLNLGVVRNGLEVFGLGYRLAWVHTLNGSNVNGGDTNHLVQSAIVRGAVPIVGRWGVGADAMGYLRDSYFEQIGFDDVEQKVGVVRVFGWFRTF
jgi:hypothetical protein